jgi:4-hydroxyphenylpyruvate dioxygenase
MEPQRLQDKDGEVVLSGIHTYGDTVHLFVERKNYTGPFMPGFRAWKPILPRRYRAYYTLTIAWAM